MGYNSCIINFAEVYQKINILCKPNYVNKLLFKEDMI